MEESTLLLGSPGNNWSHSMPMRAYPPPYPAAIDPVTIGEPTSEQKITKEKHSAQSAARLNSVWKEGNSRPKKRPA